jgi:hypothetical protein
VPHRDMYVSVGDLDQRTVVVLASALLTKAGYDGAYSGRVIAALEHRYDVLGTIGLRADTFLEPIMALVEHKSIERAGGALTGRIADVEVVLRAINESTGVISQSHQQKLHSVAG